MGVVGVQWWTGTLPDLNVGVVPRKHCIRDDNLEILIKSLVLMTYHPSWVFTSLCGTPPS